MKWMMLNDVIPRVRPLAEGAVLRFRMLLTVAVAESTLAELLKPVTDDQNTFSLAFLPSPTGTRLRITVQADSDETAGAIIDDVDRRICDLIGDRVFGRDDQTMAEVVGAILSDCGQTLAVAESCTGGLISNWLTDIPGSSAHFMNGAITYSNEAKIGVLGVNPETLEKHGAVSEEVAREMAAGVREFSGTDFGISTTGIAGPGGGTDTKPVGLVYIGYSDKNTTFAKKITFLGTRLEIKTRSAQAALNLLRQQLLKL